MITVVTIAREHGSGGTELGRHATPKLEWELLDRQLVDRVAHVVRLAPDEAAQLDKHATRWWHCALAARMSLWVPFPFRLPGWSGEADEGSVHAITTRLIQAVADIGECVIVGRGGQCFLQNRTDVLNVLGYAPLEHQVCRFRTRQPECADPVGLIKKMDSQSARYPEHSYHRDWRDKTLYDLCVNTALGLDGSQPQSTSKRSQNHNEPMHVPRTDEEQIPARTAKESFS